MGKMEEKDERERMDGRDCFCWKREKRERGSVCWEMIPRSSSPREIGR